MAISHIPEERKAQLTAIEIQLATAPDIRDDLKTKFGYGENKFFDLDLFEYRVNNSREDIAKALDLEERYDLINTLPRHSVGSAFRGHHDEDFFPEYQFEGLFSEEMNDMIEKIRASKGGLIGGLIGGRATVETHGDQMRNGGLIGGRKGGRARALAQGNYLWSLEEIADIHNFKEESIGKGLKKTQPSWDYTTSNMNEKYDKNWSTNQVKGAYKNNKDKLPDEEE